MTAGAASKRLLSPMTVNWDACPWICGVAAAGQGVPRPSPPDRQELRGDPPGVCIVTPPVLLSAGAGAGAALAFAW